MPLSVAMPCGFEENLMDFECSGGGGVAGSWGSGGHTVTDFDHPDPLLMVSLNPKDHHSNDGIGAIAGSKTDLSSSWCRNSNSRSSSMSGLAGSGSSSTPGNNSSCNTSTTITSSSNSSTCNSSSSSSGLSSSSYCRRLGSASNSSRRSATFQLWSPRLRLRDERKRVLKLSLAKLRRIDDAESCLRRSVLLNNTLRRLQRDARDEKSGGGQTNNHVISSAENDCSSRLHQQHPAVRLSSLSSEEDNNNHQAELQTMRSLLSCDELPLLNSGSSMAGGDLSMVENGGSQSRGPAGSIKRRRTSSDVTADDLAASLAAAGSLSSSLDSSCGGLNFGDLYLPPTPRMISSLEDEEEAAEAWQCVKRPKISSNSTAGSDVSGRNRPALRPCNSLPSLTTTTSSSSTTATSSSSSSNQNNSPILTGYTSCLTSGLSLINGSNSSSSSAAAAAAAAAAAQQSTYSCGQSSLFGELQSVVFHSLITSLES
ncbi:uncharacterized protein DDB_G0271670-like [Daphnia pulicaria]|uniref:uncharacterized protein DDB_G0271670-like n=1 Tax=Daphnia pulicaria TaxID=35523 RepID=UPI001EEC9CC3|nr:uncharacterized protein DDB_G0271670-like [Daphnia pulicaria]